MLANQNQNDATDAELQLQVLVATDAELQLQVPVATKRTLVTEDKMGCRFAAAKSALQRQNCHPLCNDKTVTRFATTRLPPACAAVLVQHQQLARFSQTLHPSTPHTKKYLNDSNMKTKIYRIEKHLNYTGFVVNKLKY